MNDLSDVLVHDEPPPSALVLATAADAARAAAPPRLPVETWAAAARPPAWQIAAARAHAGWAAGSEVTRAEFDGALRAAATVELR